MAKDCGIFTHEYAIVGNDDGIFTAIKDQPYVMAAPEECSPFFDVRNGRVTHGKRTPDTPLSKVPWTVEKNSLAAPAAYDAAAWAVRALLWVVRRRAEARQHAAAVHDIASGLLIAADGAADPSDSARRQMRGSLRYKKILWVSMALAVGLRGISLRTCLVISWNECSDESSFERLALDGKVSLVNLGERPSTT